MIRFGFLMLLLNAAGVALAVLGYLCVRDGHEWFAVAFLVMAFCTITVPKGSFSVTSEKSVKNAECNNGQVKGK